MSENPLSSQDAAERAQFLHLAVRTAPPVFFLLSVAESFMLTRGTIGSGLFLVLLLLNLPFTAGIVLAVWKMIEGTARGFTNMVYAGGNLPPTPQHSAHESLVARGFYAEAIAAYRQHLNSLDANYFLQGKHRIEALRKWSQGRSKRPPALPANRS